jgi:hypothetical protein
MARKQKPKSEDEKGIDNFEDEANEPPPVPFDDALRRLLGAKPQHKPTKPNKEK